MFYKKKKNLMDSFFIGAHDKEIFEFLEKLV
jgi:hypothetical protein